jgi:hypothetical protein
MSSRITHRMLDVAVAKPCSEGPRIVAGVRHPSMLVDLMLPAGEKIVLVLEGIGDDQIRVNSSSLDHPLTILADQALEIVGIEKKVMVGRAMRLGLLLAEPRPEWVGRFLRAGQLNPRTLYLHTYWAITGMLIRAARAED